MKIHDTISAMSTTLSEAHIKLYAPIRLEVSVFDYVEFISNPAIDRREHEIQSRLSDFDAIEKHCRYQAAFTTYDFIVSRKQETERLSIETLKAEIETKQQELKILLETT